MLTAAARGVDLCACARQGDILSRTSGALSASHPIFNLLGHGDESLFHISRVQGGRLQKGDPHFIRQFLQTSKPNNKNLSGCVFDHPLGSQVALVAYEELADTFAAVPLHLLQPHADIGKGLGVSDVIDDNYAMGTTIVGGGDGAKALLPSCVPDLQLDRFTLQVDCADFKVDSDGANEALRVCIVREPEQQTALSHARVTN